MIVMLRAVLRQLSPFFERDPGTQLLKDFADWPARGFRLGWSLFVQKGFDQSQNLLLLSVRKRLKLFQNCLFQIRTTAICGRRWKADAWTSEASRHSLT